MTPLPHQRIAVDWRRLRGPVTLTCFVASFIGAIATSLGTVIAGSLAENPTLRGITLLAVCVIGSALIDTLAKTAWVSIVDRAEGRLRSDLLVAIMAQPLSALTEQAVGEILDRIDDDTHEVGQLLRWQVWQAVRTALAALPLWLVAGLTWTPAFALFPLTGVAVYVAIRGGLPEISRRKVLEEMAWTDHAAAMEEGIAARDDLRTSLGQAYVVRRCAELSRDIFDRLKAVLIVEVRVGAMSGTLLHGVLAATALIGSLLVLRDQMSVGQLITLFLVTTTFVGQIDQLARHLPDLQAGFGAVLRLRQLMASEPEPAGGQTLPDGPLDVEFRDLHFSYETGTFALSGVSLAVQAGHTCALVGRSGAGKSTLASLISRAVEPERGTVFVGGVDVLDLDLQVLRRAIGVVTQRTEILAGTLGQNIALFAPLSRERVQGAVDELGLTDWVESLPEGLDTPLGAGGTSLSAGEEQLVAFARLLVRDVRVVVLDEATARMDPVTEARVVAAADRLISGRTGLLVAHRLTTIERAEQVAVFESGRITQQGDRAELATEHGPYRELLLAAASLTEDAEVDVADLVDEDAAIGTIRRTTDAPVPDTLEPAPGMIRGIWHVMAIEPWWGLFSILTFLAAALTSAYGALTGWAWGHLVTRLQAGESSPGLLTLLVGLLMVSPLLLVWSIYLYPRWWVAVMLRVRMRVLHGQTSAHRLDPTPPGEVLARAMDADRLARYGDRWVDLTLGFSVVAATMLLAQSWFAGGVLLLVMFGASTTSAFGRSLAGRSVAAASAARAAFGRALVSALESIRTVKLAAATPDVHTRVESVDAGRVDAAVFEHRVQALLNGVPVLLVQGGVVAAWLGYVTEFWSLATAILVSSAVGGFEWFGRVAGAVVTEAPGTRHWMQITSALAGGGDLMRLPHGVDLVHGIAPAPAEQQHDPLKVLAVQGLAAIHEDGNLGAQEVSFTVKAGELVLLLGQVGSGKSSLLKALAGLVHTQGTITWNDLTITDPETELRPRRIAYVAQTPRVLSGTFRGNIALDHPERDIEAALHVSRLEKDVVEAGGADALVGHRGVRLSGGQVQRLALARALACDAELLLADDVSSALDAVTEVELWSTLRGEGRTVLGATSKAAALSRADRVLVMADGTIVDQGPWSELSPTWGHLAG